MLIKDILTSVPQARIVLGTDQADVAGVFHDSRQVKPGGLFVAISGFKLNGHDFLDQAARNGAAALVIDEEYLDDDAAGLESFKKAVLGAGQVTVIQTSDTRQALALISARFYGDPSSKIKLVGVTGTNGKTTTTYLLQSIFQAGGDKGAVIGTLASRIGDEVLPAGRTTPESSNLQKLLARVVEAKAGYAALEVSSHAVSLKRIAGCQFACRVLTNVTGDHLDFHKSFEEYAAVKRSFLTEPIGTPTVLNLDDKAGQEAADYLRAKGGKVISYALKDEAADVRAEKIKLTPQGTTFELVWKERKEIGEPAGRAAVSFPLLGLFNVTNALAAAGAALALGLTLKVIAQGLGSARIVPGRTEKIDEGQDFTVLVDYAHTPDGLKQVLLAVRPMTKGRVITVFGCGGDRDRTKRPQMGYIAGRLSDWVILTSDNPRSEDPVAIIQEIEDGLKAALLAARHGQASTVFPSLDIDPEEEVERAYLNRGYGVEADREKAIAEALTMARAGDLVLLAGKGHESEQIFKDRTVHFDDREIARYWLKERLNENIG